MKVRVYIIASASLLFLLMTSSIIPEIIGGWRNWSSNKSIIEKAEMSNNTLFLLETLALSKINNNSNDRQNLLILNTSKPETPKLISSLALPFIGQDMKVCGNNIIIWSNKNITRIHFDKKYPTKVRILEHTLGNDKSGEASKSKDDSTKTLYLYLKKHNIENISQINCNASYLALQSDKTTTIFKFGKHHLSFMYSNSAIGPGFYIDKKQLINMANIDGVNYLQIWQLATKQKLGQVKTDNLCCPSSMFVIKNKLYFYDVEMTSLAAFDIKNSAEPKNIYIKRKHNISDLIRNGNQLLFLYKNDKNIKHTIYQWNILGSKGLNDKRVLGLAKIPRYYTNAVSQGQYLYLAAQQVGLVIIKLER